MAEVVGPLGRVLTEGGLTEGSPAQANALIVLRRCAVVEGTKLVESAQLGWAVRTNLGYAPELARAAYERRRAAVASLAGGGPLDDPVAWRLVPIEPDAALLVGAGESGVRNVGLAQHGTYGWPVLRGSALKGVTHAYARDVAVLPEAERIAIFGTRPGVAPARPGAVAFLDATWTGSKVRIARHVLTPHAGEYYSDRDRQKPPAEYWNPVPVEFLAVEAGVFPVTLVGPDSMLDTVKELLVAALDDLGVGAKTAAGYGYLTQSRAGTP